MTPRTIHKIGRVKIKINARDGIFYVAYPNPNGKGPAILESTGHKAETPAQRSGQSIPAPVRQIAKTRFDQYVTGTTPAPTPQQNRVTISQAFDESISRSLAGPDHRKNLIASSSYFADWLELHHPAVLYWDQVTPRIVHEYVEAKAAAGVGPKTLKHYVGVVTLTASYWARVEPAQYHAIKIVSPHLVSKTKPAKNYLNLAQLNTLLTLTRESQNPSYFFAVLLGGFAGLNLKEMLPLTRESFDAGYTSVTVIDGKTKYRNRTIPLLPFVTQNLIAAGGFEPLTRSTGGPASHDTLGKGIRKILNKCPRIDSAGLYAYSTCDPKDMRKSFANLAVAAKVRSSDLGYYMGHTPKSMTDRVYGEYDTLDYLKATVVDPISKLFPECSQNPEDTSR